MNSDTMNLFSQSNKLSTECVRLYPLVDEGSYFIIRDNEFY